jgi:hypothetical protein
MGLLRAWTSGSTSKRNLAADLLQTAKWLIVDAISIADARATFPGCLTSLECTVPNDIL